MAHLVDAIEKQKERRRFSSARVRGGGSVGVGGRSGERTSAMAFSKGMTEGDPFSGDQRLKSAQSPGVGVEKYLS